MGSSLFILAMLVGIQSVMNPVHAGVSREQMEKLADGFRKTCIGKTGADFGLVSQIRDGTFIEDPVSKCYTKCIMAIMKTFTKQGTIDIDMMIKQINIMATPDLAGRMITPAQKCYEETTAPDACELAWQFTKCLHGKDPEIFFFP